MTKLSLLFLLALTASSQTSTATFSPQSSANNLVIWNVDVYAPGKVSVPAAQIYAIAANHKIGHVSAINAEAILSTKAKSSAPAIITQILGGGSALTAVGSLIKSQGVPNPTTASQIALISGSVAGVCAIVLPYFQKAAPTGVPDPSVAASLLGDELKLGMNGSGSALFYSLNSGEAFVEVLK